MSKARTWCGAVSTETKRFLQGAFWIAVYLILVLAPLFILLLGPVARTKGFWLEFSVALGFSGLAMIGLQFALTARFKHIKSPYGSDIVYYFHRQISVAAVLIVVAHPLILFVTSPSTIKLLNVASAPWRARAGVAAIFVLFVITASSLWRRGLGLEYAHWRRLHGILAILIVILATAHVVGVGRHVATPWKTALWIIYASFWIGLLVWVRIVKPVIELRTPYVVESVTQERGQAWTVAIRPVGHEGIRFDPGQFAWLTMWASPFSDREHPFSFSSSATVPERLEFTIKEVGDFTARIKTAERGQLIYLDGPYGAFTCDRHYNAPGYVFIAGGIGITPIMSMLRTLADRGDRRHLLLVYANRTWADVTFREEIATLTSRLTLSVIHVLSQPHAGWEGEQGRVSESLLRKHLPVAAPDCDYFICGPVPMMQATEKALKSLGIPLRNIHTEVFNLV
jgi:3-phenylpropionate/trans-cinnamate dioxygenase ferredoxin reductase subunit